MAVYEFDCRFAAFSFLQREQKFLDAAPSTRFFGDRSPEIGDDSFQGSSDSVAVLRVGRLPQDRANFW